MMQKDEDGNFPDGLILLASRILKTNNSSFFVDIAQKQSFLLCFFKNKSW